MVRALLFHTELILKMGRLLILIRLSIVLMIYFAVAYLRSL